MTYIVLLTVVTAVQLQSQMLAAMTLAGLPTSAWSKNGLWQNLTNWVAILYQGLYSILRAVAENAFLETATGQGLIDLGTGTFGTAYRGKTFATGTVTLSNASGAPLDELADSISFGKVGAPDVTYRNSTNVFILNGNQLAIDVQCDIAGTVGNVLATNAAPFNLELITTIVGVSIVEHSAFVGQDEQSEGEYRSLCTRQAGSLSPGGAKEAWQWFPLNLNTDGTVAIANDGKTRVNINRVRVASDNANGIVEITLASPSGPVDAGEYSTTVTFLEQYVLPNPGTLVASNCAAVPITIIGTVELDEGTPTAGVKEALETYVADWFGTVDNTIGASDGFFTLDELKLLIGRGNSKIRRVTLVSPAADVPISSVQSAQAGPINFTITVQP